MNTKTLEAKRHFINGKIIIGIDPSKKKHQAAPIDSIGVPLCKSFSFNQSYYGFNTELWKKLNPVIPDISPERVVFAVEVSINLWQKLCYYLTSKGYTVLMVSPLYTKHERPKINNNFSRTDPKDALAVANCARQGYFNYYKKYPSEISAMHRLSITYDKLMKHLRQVKQRIRSQVELIFPEFPEALDIDTDTARHLLSKYITPGEFLKMNIFSEAPEIEKLSRQQHGKETLKKIKEAAKQSIGLHLSDEELFAERITLNSWLGQYKILKEQIDSVIQKLVSLARATTYFNCIFSLKGISNITAARFIAEVRDLLYFNHYKKIEAFSGMNLKLSESGQYTGYRRISHIGNHRLRAILYKMAEETKNSIPEIRIRYLKRQMKQPRYKKNVTACTSNLLKLIVSLTKDNHQYLFKDDKLKELKELEDKYKEFKKNKKYKQSA